MKIVIIIVVEDLILYNFYLKTFSVRLIFFELQNIEVDHFHCLVNKACYEIFFRNDAW